MPRARKPHPAGATPPPIAPPTTRHLFAGYKRNDRQPLTHETIAADLRAFHAAGGQVELLGVTRTLHRIGADAEIPAPAATSTPARRR